MKKEVEGKIVDIYNKEIFEGAVVIDNERIVGFKRRATTAKGYIIPGFIDSHVHIESSMLTPRHFGELIMAQGTLAIVTDPHEIANVMGVKGINFMMGNSTESPVKMYFSIPSCVPSTPFDVAGDIVSAADVEQLAATDRFVALSEMMNVPGVLNGDADVVAKLKAANKYHLPIDGHSPGLNGKDLETYIKYGVSTDHECFSLVEAEEKIKSGMKILIREGSAARNYEGLKQLISKYPDKLMFCTDDAHPDDIIERGHIDKMVRRAVADGFDLFDVLKIATVNAIEHYNLNDVGRLRIGDKADFIIVEDLTSFHTEKVFVDGVLCFDADNKEQYAGTTADAEVVFNHFDHDKIDLSALRKPVKKQTIAIELVKNELLTNAYSYIPKVAMDNFESDMQQDMAKIVYINRYNNGAPQVALCKGFGLNKGAFASSVAHDTHNIIAVGCSDMDLCRVINALIESKGGLATCDGQSTEVLPLPIGGIMSNRSGHEVASEYKRLSGIVNQLGCQLNAPFMTLSFMSLVVIPEIKIGEKGLFSYSAFDWIEKN